MYPLFIKSFVLFFPYQTHCSLTSVLALSCWMQKSKPEKHPQCRSKESSGESPAENNFWLAVIVFVEDEQKTSLLNPKEQRKLTKVS